MEQKPENTALPLTRLQVIEFSHMVMGPAAGVILADLGADVLKVEPLGGDNTRRLSGSGGGYFAMYNRNKKSLCVDLKNPKGRQLVCQLVDKADVLIENFRPGAMERLGFGYAALSARNQGLIYCSLKGFLSGPYEKRAALDEVTQMLGGLAYMTGLPDRPMRAGSSVIDITGGMFGVIGILAALNQRQTTGRGQLVTSALFETTAFMVGQHMAQEVVLGEAPPPMSVRRSAWAVYDLFECADGTKLFVAVVSDTQWRAFCEHFSLHDLGADPALATNNGRTERREQFMPTLVELFRQLPRHRAVALLEGAGLPFAEINRPSDLFDDPHLGTDGLVDVHITEGERRGTLARLPKLPLEMNSRRLGLRHDLPPAGADSRDAAARCGCTEEMIGKLLADGVIAECQEPAA